MVWIKKRYSNLILLILQMINEYIKILFLSFYLIYLYLKIKFWTYWKKDKEIC